MYLDGDFRSLSLIPRGGGGCSLGGILYGLCVVVRVLYPLFVFVLVGWGGCKVVLGVFVLRLCLWVVDGC